MRIFGTMIEGLGAALEAYHARHAVLAENVANSETPGYRARDIDFGAALEEAFESGAGADSRSPLPEPSVDRQATVKLDGNSVDLDLQMGELSSNAFKIVALSQLLAQRYDGLKRAIDGGKV